MTDFDYRAALDPERSVVIEACAGSGKTWLLVSRILRLLLAGAEPGEILAITFTRKAAQEMQARLREWLGLLALAPEAEARDFLRQRALAAHEIDAALPRARQLLERVLSAEPPLTINTFHGWFLQLLQRAPLESGALGSFGLLEQTAALQEEAWQELAEDLAEDESSPVAGALRELFRAHGLGNTRALLLDFVARRAEWWAYTAGQENPVAYALEKLRLELDVDPDRDVQAELWPSLAEWLRDYAALLGKNLEKDQRLAEKLLDASAEADPARRFEQVWDVCFIQKGTPRVRKPSKAQAARLGGEHAEARLLELHDTICALLLEARERLTVQSAYRLNRDGLRCGAALLEGYQRLKESRQMLDFADIEWRVSHLLGHGDYAGYMQYKLDSRYRHILLDEFQDTNPLQWQVLQSWLSAYGADAGRPTVFMVGDPKQSIYRFRRAEARLFGIAAGALERDFAAARLEQDSSRRSAGTVIAAVNRVFDGLETFAGFRPHGTHHRDMAGAVAILPLAEREAATETAAGFALRNPLEQPRQENEDARHEQEAALLAEKIAGMVGSWEVVDEKHGARPARYRDIMILVRSRTWLATYERALRAARIPYIGSRQGGLLDTLECNDLTALLEFLVTPFADLKLAQVLRSPIFACTDADLMTLAAPPPTKEGRERPGWWQRLRQLPAANPALLRARELLSAWQDLADRLPVHDLLDRIYFEGEVLERYRQAVPEAISEAVRANLNAFIELALAMDSGRYPSLTRFINEVAALRRAPDQEAPDEGLVADSGDAVRILTVHGAKGLEAPIVWLLDAHTAPRGDSGYRVLLDWPPEADRPTHFSLLGRKEALGRARANHAEDEAAHAARENLNLLYVAMTRARQALIVSGCENARAGESWYSRLRDSLADMALPEALASGAPGTGMSPGREPAPRQIFPAVPPTGKRAVSSPARLYGIRLHSLMEWIRFDQAPEQQAEALRMRLGVDEPAFAPLWREVLAMLKAPALRRFLDPALHLAAHNELSYLSRGGETRRIDRLVEFPGSVWILDYKTTEAPDADLAALTAAYRPQLLAYRADMADIFPGKALHCALIFPGPTLIEI